MSKFWTIIISAGIGFIAGCIFAGNRDDDYDDYFEDIDTDDIYVPEEEEKTADTDNITTEGIIEEETDPFADDEDNT